MAITNTSIKKENDPNGGSNQVRVRAYNERLILSLVRRHGQLPKSEIARRSGLSAQTASVIMRSLEKDGLLLRSEPIRGKVGQPSIPMRLNPSGVYSLGLKIGRRNADLFLVDFLGEKCKTRRIIYDYPVKDKVLEFANNEISELLNSLKENQKHRVAGIGVAIPFKLWNWADKIGVAVSQLENWQVMDIDKQLQARHHYPVFIRNDATAACGAELVFGHGSQLTDFIYFSIDTFIGGGIVLNHALYTGRTGNAGALGSMPVINHRRTFTQLIDNASLIELEEQIKNHHVEFLVTDFSNDTWHIPEAILEQWINKAAMHIATAIVSACAVIDFEAAIIDGDLPEGIKNRLVEQVRSELFQLDLQGIDAPSIYSGVVGREAKAMGAASLPLSKHYLLDQSVLFNSGG